MGSKIGILTYHHTTNFGSLLQTYGLVKKVNDLGYDCDVINYYNDAVENREKPKMLSDCRDWRAVRDYFKYESFKKNKNREFETFLSTRMHLSKESYNRANIADANKVYDTFLVGSDLVWDDTINDHDRTYMLDFALDGSRKIAYASSTGQLWPSEDNEVQRLLNRFDAIGVREKEIADALNNMLDNNVDFVGDPTLLLDRSEWDGMACDRIIAGDYVLIYFTDDKLRIYEDAIRYGKEHNIQVYAISYGWLPKGIKPVRPTKLEEFLSLIKYANTVFSASYHGMLFSIYFNRQFFYYNRGWKSRMRSIAEYLDITDREHYDPEKNKEIDYQKVNALMDDFRDRSVSCLKSYLEA